MTVNELQKLIDWINNNAIKYAHEYYNEEKCVYELRSSVCFNELMALLARYPVSDTTEGSNADHQDYKDSYERCLDSLEEKRDEIRKLNTTVHDLLEQDKHRLREITRLRGAVAMAELIFGGELKV